jgi:UDP-2,3-diacylglucosamine hydrolase
MPAIEAWTIPIRGQSKPAMSAQGSEAQGPLAIICGGGSLPFAVADAVIARGRKAILFAISGAADVDRVSNYTHHWLAIGEADKLFGLLRHEGCRDVVFIGSVTRPPIWKIRIGWQTLLMLPTILSSFRGGDNHLLSTLERIGERAGFRVVAAHEVAPDILMRQGTVTRRAPHDADGVDIARGLALLRAIGPFDVGQAAVVVNRHVLAVEGIEGTDAMLARIADLRRRGRVNTPAGTGVLIKAPKPDQDRRFDLPTIGPSTVEAVREAGLGGIALVADETLIAEPQLVVSAADRAGLFVTGIKAPE